MKSNLLSSVDHALKSYSKANNTKPINILKDQVRDFSQLVKSADRDEIVSKLKKKILPESYDPDKEWNILKDTLKSQVEIALMNIEEEYVKMYQRQEKNSVQEMLKRRVFQKTQNENLLTKHKKRKIMMKKRLGNFYKQRLLRKKILIKKTLMTQANMATQIKVEKLFALNKKKLLAKARYILEKYSENVQVENVIAKNHVVKEKQEGLEPKRDRFLFAPSVSYEEEKLASLEREINILTGQKKTLAKELLEARGRVKFLLKEIFILVEYDVILSKGVEKVEETINSLRESFKVPFLRDAITSEKKFLNDLLTNKFEVMRKINKTFNKRVKLRDQLKVDKNLCLANEEKINSIQHLLAFTIADRDSFLQRYDFLPLPYVQGVKVQTERMNCQRALVRAKQKAKLFLIQHQQDLLLANLKDNQKLRKQKAKVQATENELKNELAFVTGKFAKVKATLDGFDKTHKRKLLLKSIVNFRKAEPAVLLLNPRVSASSFFQGSLDLSLQPISIGSYLKVVKNRVLLVFPCVNSFGETKFQTEFKSVILLPRFKVYQISGKISLNKRALRLLQKAGISYVAKLRTGPNFIEMNTRVIVSPLKHSSQFQFHVYGDQFCCQIHFSISKVKSTVICHSILKYIQDSIQFDTVFYYEQYRYAYEGSYGNDFSSIAKIKQEQVMCPLRTLWLESLEVQLDGKIYADSKALTKFSQRYRKNYYQECIEKKISILRLTLINEVNKLNLCGFSICSKKITLSKQLYLKRKQNKRAQHQTSISKALKLSEYKLNRVHSFDEEQLKWRVGTVLDEFTTTEGVNFLKVKFSNTLFESIEKPSCNEKLIPLLQKKRNLQDETIEFNQKLLKLSLLREIKYVKLSKDEYHMRNLHSYEKKLLHEHEFMELEDYLVVEIFCSLVQKSNSLQLIQANQKRVMNKYRILRKQLIFKHKGEQHHFTEDICKSRGLANDRYISSKNKLYQDKLKSIKVAHEGISEFSQLEIEKLTGNIKVDKKHTSSSCTHTSTVSVIQYGKALDICRHCTIEVPKRKVDINLESMCPEGIEQATFDNYLCPPNISKESNEANELQKYLMRFQANKKSKKLLKQKLANCSLARSKLLKNLDKIEKTRKLFNVKSNLSLNTYSRWMALIETERALKFKISTCCAELDVLKKLLSEINRSISRCNNSLCGIETSLTSKEITSRHLLQSLKLVEHTIHEYNQEFCRASLRLEENSTYYSRSYVTLYGLTFQRLDKLRVYIFNSFIGLGVIDSIKPLYINSKQVFFKLRVQTKSLVLCAVLRADWLIQMNLKFHVLFLFVLIFKDYCRLQMQIADKESDLFGVAYRKDRARERAESSSMNHENINSRMMKQYSYLVADFKGIKNTQLDILHEEYFAYISSKAHAKQTRQDSLNFIKYLSTEIKMQSKIKRKTKQTIANQDIVTVNLFMMNLSSSQVRERFVRSRCRGLLKQERYYLRQRYIEKSNFDFVFKQLKETKKQFITEFRNKAVIFGVHLKQKLVFGSLLNKILFQKIYDNIKCILIAKGNGCLESSVPKNFNQEMLDAATLKLESLIRVKPSIVLSEAEELEISRMKAEDEFRKVFRKTELVNSLLARKLLEEEDIFMKQIIALEKTIQNEDYLTRQERLQESSHEKRRLRVKFLVVQKEKTKREYKLMLTEDKLSHQLRKLFLRERQELLLKLETGLNQEEVIISTAMKREYNKLKRKQDIFHCKYMIKFYVAQKSYEKFHEERYILFKKIAKVRYVISVMQEKRKNLLQIYTPLTIDMTLLKLQRERYKMKTSDARNRLLKYSENKANLNTFLHELKANLVACQSSIERNTHMVHVNYRQSGNIRHSLQSLRNTACRMLVLNIVYEAMFSSLTQKLQNTETIIIMKEKDLSNRNKIRHKIVCSFRRKYYLNLEKSKLCKLFFPRERKRHISKAFIKLKENWIECKSYSTEYEIKRKVELNRIRLEETNAEKENSILPKMLPYEKLVNQMRKCSVCNSTYYMNRNFGCPNTVKGKHIEDKKHVSYLNQMNKVNSIISSDK